MNEVRETWGKYASNFAAEGSAAETRESIRTLIELAELRPGSLVVDVATGAGYTAFALTRAGCRVVPLDPTHEMLVSTREGWRERGFDGEARCVEAWAEALPFRDASLDAVISHRAPHQFADVHRFADEAHRVLKPGGVLGIADQSMPDGSESWHNDLERMRDPTHERARSVREWREIFKNAGLTVRSTVVVFQEHNLEEWFWRVNCPPDRRERCLEMLQSAPEIYAYDGTRMRTPQAVVVASL